ncbi:MAG: LysM peptidoglycan-binding domain-containing protein [Planctomycetota bacterium]
MNGRLPTTAIDRAVGPRWWISVPIFLLGVLLVAQRFPESTRSAESHSVTSSGAVVRTVGVSGRIGPRAPSLAVRVSPVQPAKPERVVPQEVPVTPGPPTPSPPPKRPVEAPTHTVRKGESLWGIAARCLGDGSRWPEIAAANPQLDPKRLRAGDRLAIPGAPSPPVPPGDSPRDRREPRYHTVKAGETLSHLAVMYYTDRDWHRILRANRDQLKQPTGLREGMRILIPEEDREGLADAGPGGRRRRSGGPR